MERFHHLLSMPEYREAQEQIDSLEKTRIYCGHSRNHCMDVARIAYILVLEEQLSISKEMTYTTAFLHDIGRANEYLGQCSHESGSVLMALKLLPKCGFNDEEIHQISDAIANHRQCGMQEEKTLAHILYRADKLSRDCADCNASATCKWTDGEKNDVIQY